MWISMKIGPTGTHSRGKVHPADDGDLMIGIRPDKANGIVEIHFGCEVSWLGMEPDIAIQMAAMLIRSAEEIMKGSQ